MRRLELFKEGASKLARTRPGVEVSEDLECSSQGLLQLGQPDSRSAHRWTMLLALDEQQPRLRLLFLPS